MKKICLFMIIVSLFLVTTGCENSNNKIENNSNIKENEKKEDKKTKATDVHTGDVLKTDDYEITLNTLDFKSELEYNVSSDYITSVEIEDGKKAIALSGIFKNLTGEKITDYYAIKCQVIIDDKYNYNGSFIAWQELEPLVEAPFVLYAQIPDSLVDSYKKIEFIFGFNNGFEVDYNSKVEQLDNVFKIVQTK